MASGSRASAGATSSADAGAGGLSLAKRLAHPSDKAVRDAAVATLQEWLRTHPGATELELMRLWKSLFFCAWHADKVPVQQELFFHLARLTRAAPTVADRFAFLRAFFGTMRREWPRIDRHRLDKFMSLLRRFVHEAVAAVAEAAWSVEAVAAFQELVQTQVLQDGVPNGVRLHSLDVLLDEIATAAPNIETPQLQALLVPVYEHAVRTSESFIFDRLMREVANSLVLRISAAGLAAAEDAAAGKSSRKGGMLPEEAIAAAATELQATLSHTVDAPAIARALAPVGLGAPLLVDGKHRAAALRRAFHRVRLAPLACDIFAIAAHPATQGSHRKPLYALHADMVTAALRLGHWKSEAEMAPSPITAVPSNVAKAVAQTGWKPVAAAKAAPAASAAAPVSAVGVGSKRRREEAIAVKPAPAPAQRGRHAPAAAVEDESDDDDDESEEEAMPAPPPPSRASKRARMEAKPPASKVAGAGGRSGGRGAAAAVGDEDGGDGEDMMAVIAALPTVDQLMHGGGKSAKAKAATAAAAPAAAAPSPPAAAAVNSRGEPVRSILKRREESAAAAGSGGAGARGGGGGGKRGVKSVRR